jgi:outer membrane biosynthesis protein TonB
MRYAIHVKRATTIDGVLCTPETPIGYIETDVESVRDMLAMVQFGQASIVVDRSAITTSSPSSPEPVDPVVEEVAVEEVAEEVAPEPAPEPEPTPEPITEPPQPTPDVTDEATPDTVEQAVEQPAEQDAEPTMDDFAKYSARTRSQLEKAGITTLAQAAIWLRDNKDFGQLGIARTVAEDLTKQIIAAGLPVAD